MTTLPPEDETIIDHRVFDSLVARFYKAGWITSSVVTPNQVSLDYTEAGRARLEPIAQLIRKRKDATAHDAALLFAELATMQWELNPPPLSASEQRYLVKLVCHFATYAPPTGLHVVFDNLK